jgi:hypothetical protein
MYGFETVSPSPRVITLAVRICEKIPLDLVIWSAFDKRNSLSAIRRK